ncbi:hypothetical protein K491DRAFT_472334 [Lophiostoma macrostomum CBS 122681]|uniref:SRR1-like domain-containing protein n=1 Tax=Lophiostoma macrostomum CBS 122681 TaxID=1314788 RepID=A0A6A6T6I1_9PLEO|nr:hypothetical protein K491DRAFT_472334 [Lophiostoma macrostomum CBS 122681]
MSAHLDLNDISAELQRKTRRYFSRPLLLEAASTLEAAQAELRNSEGFSEFSAPGFDDYREKIWPPEKVQWAKGMGIHVHFTRWVCQGRSLDPGAETFAPMFWKPLFKLKCNHNHDDAVEDADMEILSTEILKPAVCSADGRALDSSCGSIVASTNEPLSTTFMEVSHKSMTAMTEAWQAPNNPVRTHFEATLNKQFNLNSSSSPAVHIKNIVCIGLGKMHFLKNGLYDETACNGPAHKNQHQHMFASYLSAYLSTYYASHGLLSPTDPFPIPIYAHDPAYTSRDVALLSQINPPITVLSDPYHYLQMDSHTLVIAINVMKIVPYLEIMADLLHESGGPAAILTNTIVEQKGNAQGLVHQLDLCTPPVLEMMRGFREAPVMDRDFGKEEVGMAGGWTRGWNRYSLYTRR